MDLILAEIMDKINSQLAQSNISVNTQQPMRRLV
jgi:hypothetical protein